MRISEQQCCCIPRQDHLLRKLHRQRLGHPFILPVRTDSMNDMRDRERKKETNLRVSNQDQLSIWAGVVEAVYCCDRGVDAVHSRGIIRDAATRRLTTTSWVVKCFRCSSGMGGDDQVYNSRGGAISWRCCSFTSTKDMDPRALSLNGRSIRLAIGSQKSLAQ